MTDDFPPTPDVLTTSAGLRRLGGKAGKIVEELQKLHWDNCKVVFHRGIAFRYSCLALRAGHDASEIVKCYERALNECHALATDRTAHRGYVCRFELSSTVLRARKFLERDGLSKNERVRLWYESHRFKVQR